MVASDIGEGAEYQGKDRLLTNALESDEHVQLVERRKEAGLGHLAPVIQDFSTVNQFITRNL